MEGNSMREYGRVTEDIAAGAKETSRLGCGCGLMLLAAVMLLLLLLVCTSGATI